MQAYRSATIWVLSFLYSVLTFAGTYSGGDGLSEATAYRIGCVEDLSEMMGLPEDWDMQFVLTADLDLTGMTFTRALIAPDTDTVFYFQGTAFTGVFDGNGRTIAGLTIAGGDNDHIGLFGRIGDGISGTIKNLGVTGCNVSGRLFVSGLVGDSDSGTVSNCYSTGFISGSGWVGGLVGDNYRGNLSNCYSTGSVSGIGSYVGGLVGGNNGGNLSNCHSSGSVSGSEGVGGLVGENAIGGISNCYSTGSVDGIGGVGGLVGRHHSGSVSNCYSTGSISGSYFVGGLVGHHYSGSVSICYFLDTAGPNNGVGTPLTDAQMRQQSSFAGWDFGQQWAICELTNYPRLQWQIPPADLACPDGVTLPDFAYLAARWMADDCTAPDYCAGADIDSSGDVETSDLVILAESWMQ